MSGAGISTTLLPSFCSLTDNVRDSLLDATAPDAARAALKNPNSAAMGGDAKVTLMSVPEMSVVSPWLAVSTATADATCCRPR